MSDLKASSYDWPALVTKSDTIDDPKGPFAAVLVLAAGNAVVWPVGGPEANGVGLTIAVVAGEYLRFPIKRVGASSVNVLGLVGSAVVPQGFA